MVVAETRTPVFSFRVYCWNTKSLGGVSMEHRVLQEHCGSWILWWCMAGGWGSPLLRSCIVFFSTTGSHSVASMNGTWWILKLGDDNQQSSTLVPLVCSLSLVIIILIIIIIVIVIIVIFYVHAGMIVIAFFYSYRMDDRWGRGECCRSPHGWYWLKVLVQLKIISSPPLCRCRIAQHRSNRI